jgi:hypothetical protein
MAQRTATGDDEHRGVRVCRHGAREVSASISETNGGSLAHGCAYVLVALSWIRPTSPNDRSARSPGAADRYRRAVAPQPRRTAGHRTRARFEEAPSAAWGLARRCFIGTLRPPVD